ncbi:MAG TPA: YCF48-related protein [Bacteroidales bacterium]|nr:YCF48-related protein [Bacteroidales bacterium]HPT12180.1 YCF48-related protein [Bacteroidales bacterium]
MKKILLSVLLMIFSQQMFTQTLYHKALPRDINSSFRALSVIDDRQAWVSGSNGYVGITSDGGESWAFTRVKGYEKCDFRSLYAFDSKRAVIATAGSPACILRTTNGGRSWKKVFYVADTLAFFDGMDFWNEKEGIIYGDPLNGRLYLASTTDGGKTWKQADWNNRPATLEGEASFASSGTGIRCFKEHKVMILTGGMASRLLISLNAGESWRKVSLPLRHGTQSEGAYSVAFADDTTGIIVGGDYTKERVISDFCLYSYDGGFGWVHSYSLTGGYRECVEFIDPQTAIAVGPSGMDITVNRGVEWGPFSEDKGFHVIRKARNGNLIVVAGNSRVALIRP